MTTYPAAGDYYKAVQSPATAFTVKSLQEATFAWDALGPVLARGSSAVVFKATVGGSPTALRCYVREEVSNRDRYAALGAYLASHDLSRYVSETTWLEAAIQVGGQTWPVILMDWIEGKTLNEYVNSLVAESDFGSLTTLAEHWRELVRILQQNDFAHGDLQHGDVLVDQDGRLRLVDYDGVWIPQLADMRPPNEWGHLNYEHPGRRPWGRWMDTFPALVIYLSLVALAKDSGLWLALYNGKNLLFSSSDFVFPFESEVWRQLSALNDPEVNNLVRLLQECCAPEWVATKSLEDLLVSAPAQLPRSAGSRTHVRGVSSKHPGCIVFLCDRSGSMRQPWGNRRQTMAQGVSSALNSILLELMFISQVEPGKARHYFDVGVFGYGVRPVAGGEGVETAFGGALSGRALVALPELRDNPLLVRDVPSAGPDGPYKQPIWIEPVHGYRTPMCEAIAVAGGHIYDWAAQHPDSFPPIVINITDGMVTDNPYDGATFETWVERLVSIQTNDGPLLMFNIFLSRTAAGGVLFPSTDQGLPEPGPQLFGVSSVLPGPMVANAQDAGISLDAGARGFGFNANPTMLARFLEVGTHVDLRD